MEGNIDAVNRDDVFALIGNLADLGLWRYHVGDDYLHWEDQLFKLYGVNKADFSNSFEDWRSTVHPEDLEGAESAFLESVKSDGEFVYTFRIRRKDDGQIRYIKANARVSSYDQNGQPIYIGVNQDVTEYFEIKSEREEILKILSDSQTTARIGSWQYFPKTNVSIMDGVTKSIYGIPAEVEVHASEGILYYKEGRSRDTIIQAFDKLLKEHKSYDLELELIRTDGSEIWVRTIGKVMLDEQGEVLKAYGVFQDITEHKKRELELSEANRILQNLTDKLTEQNRSLNDFAHISSHNLRAPVANLMMLNELYAESEDLQFREEIFEMVLSSTKDLKSTLDHLLDSLVIQSKAGLDMKDCSLSDALDLVDSSLSEIVKHTEAKIEREIEVDTLHAQPVYLDSILLNLINNAIKYKHPDRKPEILVRSYMDGPRPCIEVKVNGLGIDLEKHGGKVFGLHKTFHKNSDAKGVGLFMVKAQMEAMGGEVSLKSEPNSGSTFKMTFKSIEAGRDGSL